VLNIWLHFEYRFACRPPYTAPFWYGAEVLARLAQVAGSTAGSAAGSEAGSAAGSAAGCGAGCDDVAVMLLL